MTSEFDSRFLVVSPFFGRATWLVGFISLTRGGTCAPCSGSTESPEHWTARKLLVSSLRNAFSRQSPQGKKLYDSVYVLLSIFYVSDIVPGMTNTVVNESVLIFMEFIF